MTAPLELVVHAGIDRHELIQHPSLRRREKVIAYASLTVAIGVVLAAGVLIGRGTTQLPGSATQPRGVSGTYVAAAIQLERADVPATTPLHLELHINLLAYQTQVLAAMTANPNVELVLLPEGANGWFPNPRVNRSNVHVFGDRIPAVLNGIPRFVPCSSPSYANTSQLKLLSCLARSFSIVLVADLIEVRSCTAPFEVGDPPCPPDGQLLFNTAVALGQDGAVLAKYNKRHIAGTLGVLDEPTPSRLPRYFDATFRNASRVRFGLMICQDLAFTDVVYEYLALNITNILFSTHFANLYPIFLMGLHFEGFSLVHHINFIAANGASQQSRGGGIFSQGQALAYFWDTLPAATAPTHGITTATVPLLSSHPWVEKDEMLDTPPTSASSASQLSSSTQCSFIDAFPQLSSACVMFEPDRTSTPATQQFVLECAALSFKPAPRAPSQPFADALDGDLRPLPTDARSNAVLVASGLRCELTARIREDAVNTSPDKWALLVASIPLPPATECDGIQFTICMCGAGVRIQPSPMCSTAAAPAAECDHVLDACSQGDPLPKLPGLHRGPSRLENNLGGVQPDDVRHARLQDIVPPSHRRCWWLPLYRTPWRMAHGAVCHRGRRTYGEQRQVAGAAVDQSGLVRGQPVPKHLLGHQISAAAAAAAAVHGRIFHECTDGRGATVRDRRSGRLPCCP